MARYQFAGAVTGRSNQVARYGTKHTGVLVQAAGWGGCIETRVWHNEQTGKDMFRVCMDAWENSGGERTVLAEGILDARITDPFIVPAMFA